MKYSNNIQNYISNIYFYDVYSKQIINDIMLFIYNNKSINNKNKLENKFNLNYCINYINKLFNNQNKNENNQNKNKNNQNKNKNNQNKNENNQNKNKNNQEIFVIGKIEIFKNRMDKLYYDYLKYIYLIILII